LADNPGGDDIFGHKSLVLTPRDANESFTPRPGTEKSYPITTAIASPIGAQFGDTLGMLQTPQFDSIYPGAPE
jgi:hypothetical protein